MVNTVFLCYMTDYDKDTLWIFWFIFSCYGKCEGWIANEFEWKLENCNIYKWTQYL